MYVPTKIKSCQKINTWARIFISPNETETSLIGWRLNLQIFCISWEGFPNCHYTDNLSWARIRSTLLDCFKQLYPNVRTIIDCSEIFFDTPSSLDVQVCLRSDYMHHYTVNFFIAITPNGAVSCLSPLYGGWASDIHIVRDSAFLGIKPTNQVIADRGFKITLSLQCRALQI